MVRATFKTGNDNRHRENGVKEVIKMPLRLFQRFKRLHNQHPAFPVIFIPVQGHRDCFGCKDTNL